MNFLAHAHLSGNNDKLLTGNLMADAVKGKQWQSFPTDIRQGILLHRHIDVFTDRHPLVRKSKAIVRSHYGHYSGVVTDLYFDHFLAAGWPRYAHSELSDFTRHVYSVLARHYSILPKKTRRMLPFMMAQNWLHGYASPNELERIFYQMDRRTGFRSGMKSAVRVLTRHYLEIQDLFTEFYPQLQRETETIRREWALQLTQKQQITH